MKKLVLLLFICLSLPSYATNYYVKNGGNDAAAGTTDGTAWAHHPWMSGWTAAAKSLSAGDTVFLRCGDNWKDKITVAQNGSSGHPIVTAAYGTGAKPLITGFTSLAGSWNNEGGNIYSYNVSSEAKTNMVIVNGEQRGMGRYPDLRTNLYYNSGTTTYLNDPELPSSPDWDGAEVVINKWDWVLDRYLIASHSGTQIVYSNPYDGDAGTPYGGRYYFIQDHILTLTSNEEWYHNNSTAKFYIYGNPSGKTIDIATLRNLVYNPGYDYNTFYGLDFRGAIDMPLNLIGGSNYNEVLYCSVSYGGQQGIYTNGTSVKVDHCEIFRCNGTGFLTGWGGIGTATNNYIHEIGLIPGQAWHGSLTTGVYVGSPSAVVEYNRIDNIGYSGTKFASTAKSQSIRYNYITDVCNVLDDGGGIYAASNGEGTRIIEYNIIGNVGYDAPADVSIPRGIYLDEVATFYTVRYNTIFDGRDGGITVHKGHDNIITNNTIYNCRYNLHFIASAPDQVYNNTINDNIFVARALNQRAFYFTNAGSDIRDMGTLDYNTYARPIDNDYVIYTYEPTTGSVERTLANWQTYMGQDVHSTSGSLTINDMSDITIIYNPSSTAKNFLLSAIAHELDGTAHIGEVELSAWSSMVLVSGGTIEEDDDDPGPPPDPQQPIPFSGYIYNSGKPVIHNGKIINIQ